MRAANDGLRFLLELAALAALGQWGAQSIDSPLRWLIAFAAPLAAAAVWGVWLAPRSARRVSDPQRLAVETLVFGAAALALLAAGREPLAAIFAALVFVHLGLTFALGQRRT